MDLSRRYVCFFVFLGVFLLEKVLPCELPSGTRTECGDNVTLKIDCPKTCCFDETTTPKCYFEKKDYGPIQHSNGLCVNVKDGNALIWSTDCTSRNAFFLVSYDYPPYHVATGKCVLPRTNLGDPGNADLFLRHTSVCREPSGRYRPTANDNLKYFHGDNEYKICIGSKFLMGTEWEPRENQRVSIQTSVCDIDNSCQLSYVYERKFSELDVAHIKCKSFSTIELIWANYGVKVPRQYPFAISARDKNCVSTDAMSVVQNQCNGTTNCFFDVDDDVFLPWSSSCLINTILLVRYRCKSKIPAAPNILYIKVRSQHELQVVWSDNNNNGGRTKFEICWNKTAGGTDRVCHQGFYFEPTISTTIVGLQSATKYTITVRYASDGTTSSRKGQKVAITRSAPLQLQVGGIRSATSFQVKLGALQTADDMYVQIIVSKLRNDKKPTEHPGNDLLPYDENTVDNQPYIAAQLDGTNINQNSVFTVGDDKKYAPSGTRKRRSTNYQNVQLEPETYYSVFQRTFQSADLYYDSDWMDVIKTDETPLTNVFVVTTEGTQPGGGPGDEKQNGGCSEGRGAGTEDGEKYLVGIIVLIILVVILLVILAYFIYQNRRLKSSKANPESKSKDRNNSKEIGGNPDNDDANYEDANYEEVENEESTYTALKRTGEEENDGHLYAHLNEVHKDYVNQAETGF